MTKLIAHEYLKEMIFHDMAVKGESAEGLEILSLNRLLNDAEAENDTVLILKLAKQLRKDADKYPEYQKMFAFPSFYSEVLSFAKQMALWNLDAADLPADDENEKQLREIVKAALALDLKEKKTAEKLEESMDAILASPIEAVESFENDYFTYTVMNRLKARGLKTISYCESHDQALVGDKTIIFRLIDADMYWHFKKGDQNDRANRGIALHKMIRLITSTTINGGYLNFMGNEFGHPEWIDFPREGNGWSHKYARRQWNLVDNHDLCYHYLGDFDKDMLEVIKDVRNFNKTEIKEIWHDDNDQILAYMRVDLLFVYNFSPSRSFTDYGFLVPTGTYDVVLDTDNICYGGNGLNDDSMTHFTNYDPLYVDQHKEWLKLYLPARSALVLKKN